MLAILTATLYHETGGKHWYTAVCQLTLAILTAIMSTGQVLTFYFSSKSRDMQEEAQNWRELLGGLTSTPLERQRVAQELGVSSITITRWVNHEADPRPQNLLHLLDTLSEHRDSLLESIEKEFPHIADTGTAESATRDIPSAFYARVFNTCTSTAETMRYWSVCNLIIEEALGQLDPDRLGLVITVVRCFASSRSKQIRSLRESVGLGSYPWSGNIDQHGMYLGAESLAGYCVSTARSQTIQNLKDESNPLPAHQTEFEVSATTHPIMFSGRIAGCVLISSTQPNFFASPSRLTLISKYTNLLALAFDPDDFYKQEDIALLPMPPHLIQAGYFVDFRNYVTGIMVNSGMNSAEAEQFIWEELEEELLKVQANATKRTSNR